MLKRYRNSFFLFVVVIAILAFAVSGCHQANYAPPTIQITDMRITILPCVDDPEGDIHFENVTLTNGILPEGYYSPLHTVSHPGDPCFLISGRIRNGSSTRYWVAYHGSGCDIDGNEVSFTLDMGPIAGVAQIGIEPHTSENFTLHLIWSENATSFTLHSQKSANMFP